MLLPIFATLALFFSVYAAPNFIQSSSYSGQGDLSMSLVNGVLTCSKLVCPANTNKCTIYQTNSANASVIATSVQCLDAKGAVLTVRNSTAPNVAGAKVNNYSEQTVGGSSINCSGCKGNTPEEIVKNMNQQQGQMNVAMKNMERNMNSMFHF